MPKRRESLSESGSLPGGMEVKDGEIKNNGLHENISDASAIQEIVMEEAKQPIEAKEEVNIANDANATPPVSSTANHYFDRFTSELLTYLFMFLDFKEVCQIAQTCKRFQSISDGNIVWGALCEQRNYKLPKDPPRSNATVVTRHSVKNLEIIAVPFKVVFKNRHTAQIGRSENNKRISEASPKKELKGVVVHLSLSPKQETTKKRKMDPEAALEELMKREEEEEEGQKAAKKAKSNDGEKVSQQRRANGMKLLKRDAGLNEELASRIEESIYNKLQNYAHRYTRSVMHVVSQMKKDKTLQASLASGQIKLESLLL